MPKTIIKSIILFTAMVLVVSGCGRELGIKNEELKIKDSEKKDGLVKQVATTTGEELGVASSSDDFNSFEVLDEENGWKKYVNRKIGIEFKFLDKKNVINVENRFQEIANENISGQITLDDGNDRYLGIRLGAHERYNPGNQHNLKDYLIEQQMFFSGDLFGQTVVERYNDNNIKYYEILTDHLPDRYPGMEEQKRITTQNFVIEYKKDKNDSEILKDDYERYQFFEFYGESPLMNEVVKSFNFID